MAQEVNIDVASFSISSYLDQNFVLVVSTSALISVPVQYSDMSTASNLHEQVKNGSLWVARAGSCHIELSIGFGGSLKDGSRQYMLRTCVEAFENCSLWAALGLDLRREFNIFKELHGTRSIYPYSVQHSQQNSGLIAPYQVPCASLFNFSCNFTFKSKSTPVDTFQNTNTDEPRYNEIDTPRASPGRSSKPAAKQHRSRSEHQSMSAPSKSKVVTLKAPPSELRRILGVPEIYSLPLDLQEKRLEHLTHTALHLVFGSRKRFAGIQIFKKPGSLTALELAPAVWSSRYFQEVVSRVKLSSLVSSAIGNLISTDSSTFQDKMQSLGLDPFQEIHRRTLLLVLRSVCVPRLQVQVSQVGSQSRNVADRVFGVDLSNDPKKTQEDPQEKEPHATIQKDQPHDGTLSDTETDMDAYHDGPDLAHEDALIYEIGSETDEELALSYAMLNSGGASSNSHPMPEDFEDCGSGHDQLLDSEDVEDWGTFRRQNDDDRELYDDQIVDAMDEDGAEDPVEHLFEAAHRNSERALYHDRDNTHESVTDTQLYGDDADFEHNQQTCLDFGPEGELVLKHWECVSELEDNEYWEDEYEKDDCWPECSTTMESSNDFSACRTQPSELRYDDDCVDVGYDTNNLDYASNEPFRKLKDNHQYGDLHLHSNDGYSEANAASMTT